MANVKSVLARVLEEVRCAEAHVAATTAHSTYVSGVFEEPTSPTSSENPVLLKVLEEVRAAASDAAATTAHSSYVSGVFEEPTSVR